MYRKLPPMPALRAFEAAAQFLSFKQAAQQLHRTPSAISHQIRGMEEDLGVSLFHRDPHGLRLTQAGRDYCRAVHEALDTLGDATARIRRWHGQAPVTVSLFPSFAVRWLIPRLQAFRAAHPDVEIELVSSVRRVDFEGGGVDAAIRFGEGDWPGLRCDPLMAEELFPVCAPSIAAGPPPVRESADLAHATLLHNGAHPGEWRDWLRRVGADTARADRGPVLDASNEVLAAAANGLGVALGRTPLVEGDLAAGRLVAPLSTRVRTPGRYWLVAPEATADHAGLTALREWLLERIAEDSAAAERARGADSGGGGESPGAGAAVGQDA